MKTDPLLGAPLAARAWRIMYRTTTAAGDPVVATGVLVVPLLPAPSEGRTVVSWGHPTTGAARDCAPSYSFDPFSLIEGLRALLDRGYAVVATDYVGMGTDGPDSYLVGITGGNAVLDAVRAAQAVPEARASDRVILWGHSQRGQAVLFAAEEAPHYAPELQIQAVAAAAPAANLTDLMSAHLLAQGLKDELVVPKDTAAFAEHEAGLGIRVTYQEIPFATHGTVALLAVPGLMQWLDRHVP